MDKHLPSIVNDFMFLCQRVSLSTGFAHDNTSFFQVRLKVSMKYSMLRICSFRGDILAGISETLGASKLVTALIVKPVEIKILHLHELCSSQFFNFQ